MKTLEQCQLLVNEIELKYSKNPIVKVEELIRNLDQYVSSADFNGVKSDRRILLDYLDFRYYVPLEELPNHARLALNKHDLGLCIIGNFISLNGAPPPNPMARFCAEFLSL